MGFHAIEWGEKEQETNLQKSHLFMKIIINLCQSIRNVVLLQNNNYTVNGMNIIGIQYSEINVTISIYCSFGM